MKFPLKVDMQVIFNHGLRIAAIILLAFIVNWLVRRALRRVAEGVREKAGPDVGARALTLVETARSLAKYAIFFTAAVMVMNEAKIPIGPLLAGAGIAGLAIGFGAQSLVRDVVSGFFILLEGQYGVGDVVEINGILGTVEQVGLRMTRLRDGRGQVYFFPNGAINSVNTFSREGAPYLVHVPSEPAKTEAARQAAEKILADFDSEYECLASSPVFVGAKDLSTYAAVLLFEIVLLPLRRDTALERLPARLIAGLQRAGLPLPEGAEVSLLPAKPESAQWE